MADPKKGAQLPTDKVALKKGEKVTKQKLDAISKSMAAFWKRNREPVAIVLILLLAGACWFVIVPSASSLAFLYIFGQFGKFSGRMDGDVMMRNGRGRGFVVPALVRNAFTMTARGIFSVLSSSYRALGPLIIDQWTAFEMTVSDRFGRTVTIKGKDCYVRLNANLINIGQPTITSPPVLAGVDGIVDVNTVAMDASTGIMTFVFAASPTAAGISHKLFATRPISAGITRPAASEFRQIDVIPSGSTTPYDFSTVYAARFGTILAQAGNKVFLQLFAVNEVTGQMTPSVGASGTIVP